LFIFLVFNPIRPRNRYKYANRGEKQSLVIYISTFSKLSTDNINWYNPKNETIVSSSKYKFSNKRTVLSINNFNVSIDNGEYYAKVNRYYKGSLTVFYASITLYGKGKKKL